MKKRKLITVAAALAMSMLVITGCGDESSSSSSGDAKATESDASSSEEKEALKPSFKAMVLSEDKLVKLGDYGEFTYDKYDTSVSDAEVLEYYQGLIDQAVESGSKIYEKDESLDGHVIASGDVVNLDFKGTVDGVEFDGGTGNTDLPIGSGKFVPGFEDALIGKTIGETVTIDVTFPEDYKTTELAGKPAKFECVLNYGCKEVPATVDNAYSKIFGAESKEALLSSIKSYLESLKEQEGDSYVSEKQQEFIKGIVDGCEFADYSTELTEYIDKVFEAEKKLAEYYNVDFATVYTSYGFTSEEDFKEQIKQSLENQLKNVLVVNAVAKKEGIEITDEYYQTETLAIAQGQGYESIEKFENAYDCEFGEGSLKNNLIASYIQDKLIEKFVKEK